jgi:Ca-activated chloride channel family protein
VLYAGYAWTQTPLTLDYAILERDLQAARIAAGDPDKEGTAIGSALGLAVSKLKDSEAESKVVVLLTDGRNNKGSLDPITAAQIARDFGIRVYTIGAGSEGMVLVPQRTLFGTRLRRARLPVDEATLKRIAEVADGRFYRATDAEGLKHAYAEINELEKTEVEVSGYYDYDEAFMPWAVLGGLLLAGSVFSRRYWFEPIP